MKTLCLRVRTVAAFAVIPIVSTFCTSSATAQYTITEIIDATGDGAGNVLNEAHRIAADAAGNAYVTGISSDNAFKITPMCVLLGDIDSSSSVDGNDIEGFTRVKLGTPAPGDHEDCANYGTGTLEGDIAAFITDLLAP